jgi:hypothetical protein
MRDKRMPPSRRLAISLVLIVTPAILALSAHLLGWLGRDLLIWTLLGIAIAAGGGLVAGFVEVRLLRRPRNDATQLLGIAATTAVGVLTIGYLYLVHIRGPMSTVGTLSRAVEQVLIFVEYLTAQAAGILLDGIISHESQVTSHR